MPDSFRKSKCSAHLWMQLLVGCILQSALGEEKKSPVLKVQVQTISNVVYTKNNIPLKITFENPRKENVKILRYLEPRIFFKFHIKHEDGTLAFIPWGGAVALRQSDMRYIELEEGQLFGIRVNLAQITKDAPDEFKKGKYTISVTYFNRYGEDCAKGSFPADEPVSITIEEK